MAKMNMSGVVAKVGGGVAGLAIAGAVQRYLEKTNNPGLMNTYGPLGMIAAGVYGPHFTGGKAGDTISSACDALLYKGLNTLMVKNFPSFLAGADDEVSGPYYDDSVSGYPTTDETIASGYGSEPVAGYGDDNPVSGLVH